MEDQYRPRPVIMHVTFYSVAAGMVFGFSYGRYLGFVLSGIGCLLGGIAMFRKQMRRCGLLLAFALLIVGIELMFCAIAYAR